MAKSEEELVQQLGFRVVELHGAWQVQHVNEEGKVYRIKPVLYSEIWKLWQALLLPAETE